MQDVEEAFAEACAQFRTAPDLFKDEDRLHLYALYKQATAGKAPPLFALPGLEASSGLRVVVARGH